MNLHHTKKNPKLYLGQNFNNLHSVFNCPVIEPLTNDNIQRAKEFARRYNSHYETNVSFYYFVTDDNNTIVECGKFN